uniref:Ig-like domain-containing protein n=1 Tax=Macrostomum lignano TaxID=282301 RepID=A0A1I8J1C7_9PLAT
LRLEANCIASTVYYYEENPALPDRPPSVEETDSNMVHCSEEEQTAQGAIEFYVQLLRYAVKTVSDENVTEGVLDPEGCGSGWDFWPAILYSRASSIKFNITTTNIAASWQSSEYFNRCFGDTAVLEQWDYFHTTAPQTLMETKPSRAQNIEILLSDRLPPGLNASNGSCYGTLSDSLSSLTQCGVTQSEQTQTHKVACSYFGCPNVTEYILLRKNVRNESDKHMNFQALEVEEEEKPRSVSIEPSNTVQFGSRIFLASGMEFHFSFITEAAYPSPIHACRLLRKKYSACQLSVKAVKKSVKSISLPELIVPSKPEFLLPPITDWKDGHSVSVAVDSTTDSPVPTSHRCLLETRDGNRSLNATQVTNKSSKFELDVDRHWGNAASLVCLVNQSGLIQTWTRHRLPKVLYKAEGLAIRILSGDLVSDEEASFSVTASDSGYPTALHQCRIESKSLGEDKTAESDGSSHWRFTPQRGHNGERIRCDVVQKLSGSLIFSQTVNSSNLEVKYRAIVTWPSKIAPKKEGEALSFVVLADGNPEPSSQCWLQLVSGSQEETPSLVTDAGLRTPAGRMDAVALTEARTGVDLLTNFSVTSVKQMNGGSVVCRVSQMGLEDLDNEFSQNITVFFRSEVDLTGSRISGSAVLVSVNVKGWKPDTAGELLAALELWNSTLVGVAIVLSISLPATVYVWRRTASPRLGIQRQHGAATDGRPADVPLVPTVYYYEENPALPDRPPSVEETDANMANCSEEEQTAQGAVEFYVQ